ncbi:helix-turn-helix transcriptional regulator [Selenomonas ruminantium]|nr:helix-turn-helix transcriptional regulator [Selenomonas ruminantium]
MNMTPTSLSPILRSIILQKAVGADRCTVSLFVANALYFFWATTVYMALHFAGIDWPQNFFSSIIPGTEMLPDLCMMLAVFSGTLCYGLRPPYWQRYLLPVLATIMLSVMAFPFVAAGSRLLLLAFFMALSGGVFALIFHLISLHVAPDVTGRFFGFSTAFSLLLQSGFHAAFDASLIGFLTASVLCMGGLAMLLPQCLKQPASRETPAAEQPAEQTPPRVDISDFRWSVPMTLLIVVLLSLLHGIGDLYMDAYHNFNDLFGLSRLSYGAGSIAAGYFADRNRLYLPLAALFAKAQDILDIWIGQEQVLYYPLHYFGDFMNGFFTLFIILAFVDLAAHKPSLKPWAVIGRSTQMFTVSVATVFGAFILDADKLFFTLLYILAIAGCLVIVLYSGALRFNLGSAAAEVTLPLPAPDYCTRYGLTQRETEVLDCILSGQNIAEISEALFISQRTVKFHITGLLRKTGTTSQKELLLLLYEKQGK